MICTERKARVPEKHADCRRLWFKGPEESSEGDMVYRTLGAVGCQLPWISCWCLRRQYKGLDN